MREIKFKGKRVDNGKWVEGDYIRSQKGHFINDNCAFSHEIDPNTICEFTGLTDKDGVEIYEGDIFRIHEGTNDFKETYLKWDNDWLLFVPSNDDLRHRIQSKHSEHYEIIGNIHDKDAENG